MLSFCSKWMLTQLINLFSLPSFITEAKFKHSVFLASLATKVDDDHLADERHVQNYFLCHSFLLPILNERGYSRSIRWQA